VFAIVITMNNVGGLKAHKPATTQRVPAARSIDCSKIPEWSYSRSIPVHPIVPSPLQEGSEREVDAWLRRKCEGRIKDITIVRKEDLDLVGGFS